MERQAVQRRSSPSPSRASYWRSLSTRWSRSGLSQAAFCQREGVAVGTFAWWRHHLKGADRVESRGRAARGAAEFVPVRVRPGGRSVRATAGTSKLAMPSESPVQTAPVEIVLPGDVVVRVYSNCEDATLTQVLAALRGSPC